MGTQFDEEGEGDVHGKGDSSVGRGDGQGKFL